VPSTIQPGGMGAGSSATVDGSAKMICMAAPALCRR
jgi:hypothetical protein